MLCKQYTQCAGKLTLTNISQYPKLAKIVIQIPACCDLRMLRWVCTVVYSFVLWGRAVYKCN